MALTPEQKARLDEIKKKKTSPSSPTKKTGPTVSPYGDADTEAFLKKFGVAPEDMVYDPIGHQSKSTLGLTDPQVYEKWRKGNPKFIAQFEKEGKKFDPNNPEDMKVYEKYHKDYTYQGIYNALKKKGVKDETAKRKAEETANKLSFVDKKGVVNDADQKWGNYHRTRREFNFDDPEAVEQVVEVAKERKKPITEPGPVAGLPAQYVQADQAAPWWMQDVINTASAAGTRLGLKKYLPWAPPVDLETPRPTFYDPTRELAANAEQMKIGTEGAGLFAGPQAYNARFSQIQGAGARNAANILSNYHNKNVGVANQFENIRTGIMNKENMMNADSARRLYDQTTVANQQFDNAKRQANNELRASYVNALTNRAMTQTLNELYPHYQVDPSTGFTQFNQGSRLLPGRPNQTLAEQAADINTAASQAGWTTDQMLNYMGKGSKQDRSQDRLHEYDDNPYDDRADYLRQRNAMIPMTGPYGYEG